MLDLKKYLENYPELIFSDNSSEKLQNLCSEIINFKNKIFVFGNGGSASIADHFAVDMTKNANITTLSLNNASLITCLANDFGYEEWIKKALEMHANEGDMVFLISSSGKSKNVINACNYANKNNIKTITFTGFNTNNDLKKLGKINFWVDSKAYNIVENIHQIWILSLVDLAIGKSEYSAS